MPLQPEKSDTRNLETAANSARTNCAWSGQPHARACKYRRKRPPCNSSGCRVARRNCWMNTRRCKERRVPSCSPVKDIHLDRIGKRSGKRKLMVAKFRVELLENAFAQLRIAFHQKRTEGTLRQRFFAPRLIDQDTELHVHI